MLAKTATHARCRGCLATCLSPLPLSSRSRRLRLALLTRTSAVPVTQTNTGEEGRLLG